MEKLYKINANNFIEVLEEVTQYIKLLPKQGFAQCEKEEVKNMVKLMK